MAAWSAAFALVAGSLVAFASPVAAVALVVGTSCGVLNALLTMRSNERLLDYRSVSPFIVSSILRIGLFGILPVEFALHGPWWTMAAYFIGFFTPFALYTTLVARDFRTG